MSVTIHNDDTVITATITGRIDTLTSTDIERDVLSLLNESCSHLIIDISAVDYVSSAGLRVFILAQKKSYALSKALSIQGIQDPVFDIFSISGLVGLFDFI